MRTKGYLNIPDCNTCFADDGVSLLTDDVGVDAGLAEIGCGFLAVANAIAAAEEEDDSVFVLGRIRRTFVTTSIRSTIAGSGGDDGLFGFISAGSIAIDEPEE